MYVNGLASGGRVVAKYASREPSISLGLAASASVDLLLACQQQAPLIP